MKKIVAVFLLFAMLISFSSCVAPQDKVVLSLGKYDKEEYYSSGGIQDYTDYAKYYFASTKTENNKYFEQINETDLADINEQLDDFEKWIESIKRSEPSNEVVLNYDFDRKIIDIEDYYYMNLVRTTWDDGHTSITSFDIYFLDIQTQTLYYFHNNI